MGVKPMSFWVIKGKDGIWTRAWIKIHLPDFESGAVPSWATFPRCGERDLNPHARRAHAPEACVSAVPPSPLSSIIHFLKEMPRKNSIVIMDALRQSKKAGTKVLASQLSSDYRARRSGWVGSTTLISSAFTALLNCAEVGRRNRILTNYRFLSHSLFCNDLFITQLRIKVFLFCRSIFEDKEGP